MFLLSGIFFFSFFRERICLYAIFFYFILCCGFVEEDLMSIIQWNNQWTNWPISEQINRSTNQRTNRSANQPMNQPTNHLSANRPIDQSSINPSIRSSSNGVFGDNLVGLGFLWSVSYIKPIPNHGKIFCCGEKSGANATFDQFFLGLGWPWVG